jgi:hypothetical protein
MFRKYPCTIARIDEDAIIRFAQLSADAIAMDDAALAADFE